MLETSARLLKLLSLLQTYRDWSGADLAGRLGVTTRTVRRDVDRLRELGYPVRATRGISGYRLGAGAALPPLLLDDDEAVAVAIGLRTATASSVTGIEETALRALAKLERVLPSRLRHRVTTLQQATVRVADGGPRVDPSVLLAISEATARRERLRFDYTNHQGGGTVRDVEPHTLVNWGRHWYLVAWDTDRDDWRTFRVDRLRARTPSGPRFTLREPPDGDVTGYLSRQLSTGPWAVRATVTMHRPAATVADLVWPGMGAVEPVDDGTCLLHLGADTAADLAWMVTSVGVDFTVTGPPELVDAIRALGDRCRRAT
ncbi:YafY family transcriptional regulator [Micromonospora peucetia]|uniref:Predicted DNA-binding transcriptional regulator YafY, contains an HTH and WYL domains n=1 Tax=Micromonospora peucetia TaxID=47871 RepID=A0A1C6W075_9ACTN|nr:YafY family protein [Micromonospora peucetia]MCX4390833.1 YafY family transcriptional regulator [Micromonospora peucetia]WSA31771.1 YafY family transcriptional regulator [Micromonospora peucetia]SCL71981.1 Predicted DNA-binding transcriptional regulator YafY, contains an HTH and WYL domains [Micromonospora peucetia]